MTTTSDIRNNFIDFFKKNGHENVPSSPLVPQNDPTLMFANSGMVQFKNLFTGKETRSYSRAVTSQKCVRAGGKHNDLENVGYTARHHTFFEMLGNFSFGDYFKDMAIEYAWQMVTKELGLNQKKLLVTVYADDDEAASLWKKIAGLSDDKIIRISTSDNFWQMGDTGPCGPCSEIFYDHGDHIAGGPPGSPDEDGDRFIEIWNLVFMQYEQIEKGQRQNLPSPSIDTGMGLERIAAVLQGKHNNYDIDLMRALILESAHITNTDPDGDLSASHKVISDHLRSSAFLIADGVLPSNEGRGYVLRRIMRRAMRHAHLLGMRDPLLHQLVPKLCDLMGDHFSELQRAKTLIIDTLSREEAQFKNLLVRGLGLLNKEIDKLPERGTLPGNIAFTLYDTYGFPLDLTQDILRAKHMQVDINGFNDAMNNQRAMARANWAGSGDKGTDDLWFDIKAEYGGSEFLGYAFNRSEGVVQAIVKDGIKTDSISKGDKAFIITNQTPFYGESGGQKGDKGVIFTDKGKFSVKNTHKKLETLHIHEGILEHGTLHRHDEVILEIDSDYRDNLRRNHSVTHLIHQALIDILGGHVSQKGSLVSDDMMRFDFSHPQALTDEEIEKIEEKVNEQILQNHAVETKLMSHNDAMTSGATALFGEKYGDEVRVVSMGAGGKNNSYSIELCGGTHVRRLGDIGICRIISETAVASGVRRIEVTTGKFAAQHARGEGRILKTIAQLLKTSPDSTTSRIETLLGEKKKLEKELSDLRKKMLMGGESGPSAKKSPLSDVEKINDISFIGKIIHDMPGNDLKPLADDLKKKIKSGVITLIAINGQKLSLLCALTDDLTGRFDAVQLVRGASPLIGGKGGGGRTDMAQAGGNNSDGANDAIDSIRAILAQSE